ncbi:sialidase [Fundulus heteroclitus]|uniref:sialidase n=1 Tax=Fundulus heteroclitus TaxID=8078 RepID=UPI00165B52EB|nr:sialidase [Fundulus heteroclitus]
MDVRLQGNTQLHYGVNGGASRNSGPGGDSTLSYLSREEQECLQFLEETIESLEESLDDEQLRHEQRRPYAQHSNPVDQIDGLPSLTTSREVSSHDIIDLVHPDPVLVQTREAAFSPTRTDFHHILPTPEANPRHDSYPSEYNPPLRSGSFGPTDCHSSYHPPGSVPTPALIAQKIAENQGDGTSNLHPSSLLRRLSMESDKTPRDRSNMSVHHGPPTSVKPTHYPPNINVNHGGKEHQRPVVNVNLHERQEQMLANLAGTSHPLLQDNSHQGTEQNTQNSPARSISFKDPAPDKSRMEALSKLGLTRSRAASLQTTPNHSPSDPDSRPSSADLPKPNLPIPPPTTFNDTEILHAHSFKSHDERSSPLIPSSPTISQNTYPPPPPAEVTSPAFNSFGGKSIVVHPSLPQKNELPTSPTSPGPKNLQLTPSSPIEFNPYGGKSKVLTPATAPVARTNLPDILSSHIDTREPQPTDPNRHGRKGRSIDPVSGLYRTNESQTKSFKPPPPAPAPRPPRQSYHGMLPSQNAHKPPYRSLSPEYRRRNSSMFRPQGITVQFCGRGPMDESRREALRRLGLMKDS